jgi:hypothetical protein
MRNKKKVDFSNNIMRHNIMNIILKIRSIFKKPVKPKRKYVRRKPMAKAQNRTRERIESLCFTVPALRSKVLTYQPGELQTNNKEIDGKVINLYYPPESISDENFIKTLQKAPVIVGRGHGASTNETNKQIDGWSHTVKYDPIEKAAMISGVVKGNKEVSYIKNNIGEDDFGASAYVDIYDLVIESGIAPNGQEYNAIAKDLVATHVALEKHVRDIENKIKVENKLKVLNAVVINSLGAIKQDGKKMELTTEQITAIVENAVTKAVAAKNDGDRLEKLEKAVTTLSNAVEELKKDEEKEDKKEEAEAKNEEDEKEKKKEEDEESATLENAKPSQAIIAAFATAYNVEFGAKTPSFGTLAALAGIKEEDSALRIAAVNTKFAEISEKKATAENKNDNKMEVF